MSDFSLTFYCTDELMTVTFAPHSSGLLAVTASIAGRPLKVVTPKKDPQSEAALIEDEQHLHPTKFQSTRKLYQQPDGWLSHEIKETGGHADFTYSSTTTFELNPEKTVLSICNVSHLDGYGGPP